ncbi:MAG TPA: NAD(P)-dependent alcohol dehydrogenase [Nitrospiria bacterium]|nr:NAD(P)-dependent alcohol dehydrogenase [Nitrospiria bacterium]
MKAVFYRRYGGPEVLELGELQEPVIGDRQLLVKVRATSVNPVDWKFRRGTPRIPFLPMPRIPGVDVAGEIVRVGSTVTRFRAGEAVYAMLSPFAGGGCAEYAAVPERSAARAPTSLSPDEAAAVPLAALTALQLLRDLGHIEQGQAVLINGASGGVGSCAVQIARLRGAEVTAVCSARNREFVLALGAHHAIDYAVEDFAAASSRYNLMVDAVGTRSFRACRAALRPRGRYVSTLPSVSTLLGMALGPVMGGKRAFLLMARARGSDLDQLTAWIDAGQLRPQIDRRLPLSRTAEAHALSEAGHVRGKIVIHVTG